MLSALHDLLGRRSLASILLAWLGLLVTPAQAQTLLVLADSSLAGAMPAIVQPFEAAHPGVNVKLQFGASGALLDGLARSTAADVLLTSGEETAALGVQRRLLVADLRSAFASNQLVLVVPASRPGAVRRLSDLARPDVLRVAMGREASVPAGRHAREVINAQRLWPSVQRKMVITGDVREVLELVASGDVEAGFVFASDAAAARGRVDVAELLATPLPIRHLAHVTVASKQAALAGEFVASLRGAAAQGVLKGLGFGLP